MSIVSPENDFGSEYFSGPLVHGILVQRVRRSLAVLA
jgi:hypothetical protein